MRRGIETVGSRAGTAEPAVDSDPVCGGGESSEEEWRRHRIWDGFFEDSGEEACWTCREEGVLHGRLASRVEGVLCYAESGWEDVQSLRPHLQRARSVLRDPANSSAESVD